MKEEWRDIAGYEGVYQVSDLGRIKRCARITKWRDVGERILKHSTCRIGYSLVVLCVHNKAKTFSVHRLVAIAFIPNEKEKREVNHIDGVKSNNAAFNLEWCTRTENVRHANKTGLINIKGERQHLSKLNEEKVRRIRLMATLGVEAKFMSNHFKVSVSAINAVISRFTWKHLNF
jgi:hypothetical protein